LKGATVWTHAIDLREPVAIMAMFDAMAKELGPVDVLVNNAGL
jgi:NADP-dependent 3-hydroxy acid dehydrogenase YdfG